MLSLHSIGFEKIGFTSTKRENRAKGVNCSRCQSVTLTSLFLLRGCNSPLQLLLGHQFYPALFQLLPQGRNRHRLRQTRIRAETGGFRDHFFKNRPRDENHHQIFCSRIRPQPAEHFQTVHFWQPYVQNHHSGKRLFRPSHIHPLRKHEIQRRRPVRHDMHRIDNTMPPKLELQ